MGKKSNRIAAAVRAYGLPAGFFTFFFFYLLVYIDPRVIYSCNGFDLYPYVHYTCSGDISKSNIIDRHLYGDHRFILELTPSYLKGIVAVPGGITGFLTTLIVYACHYPVMGALAITAIAWLLYFLFPAYIRRCGGPPLFICGYLPAIFILSVCARYELNYLFYLLPILAALAAAIIYQRVSSRSSVLSGIVFSLLFWPVYWFFQWAALLFALFVVISCFRKPLLSAVEQDDSSRHCRAFLFHAASSRIKQAAASWRWYLTHEIFRRPKTFFIPGIAAVINIGLLVVIEHYGISIENSIHISEFFLPIVPPILVMAYFPLIAVILTIAAAHLPAALRAPPPVVRPIVLLLIVAGFFAWSINAPDNRKTRTMARTLHHMQTGQWGRILKEKTSSLVTVSPVNNSPLQQYMIHAVNRALYKTGRLGGKMYSYPQESFSPGSLLLFKNTLTYGHAQWAASLDLFLDLGLLNLAEKVAGELIECMGPYPSFIYRSALIQIAKGNTAAASVYLNRLSTMPFCRREARQLLPMCNDDKAAGSHPFGPAWIPQTTFYIKPMKKPCCAASWTGTRPTGPPVSI
jgi:hypothetical protein